MTPPRVPFPRVLDVGCPQGQDVIAVKRAVSRAGCWPWQTFSPYYTGVFAAKGMAKFQRAHGLKPDGVYGKLTHDKLRATHAADHPGEWAFDTVAVHLMNEAYLLQHPGIVCPLKVGARPSFIHETGGIDGNYALDWMAPGGTTIYAPCPLTITQLSGHDPATGTHSPGDVFGWSFHARDDEGRTYFGTHMGARYLAEGQRVKTGQRIGAVGSWPHDPGRSHLHFGVDAGSKAKSVARIMAIAQAPRP